MSVTRAIALFVAVLSVSGSLPAKADVVLPFSLQGLFIYTQSPPSQTGELFTATLTIDTTSGTILGFQSSMSLDPTSVRQGPIPGANTYFWYASPYYVPGGITLVFNTASLIGYSGGTLVDVNHPDSTGRYTSISEVHVPQRVLISGFVAPLPVPEPSSLAILAASAFASVTLHGLGSRLARSRRRRVAL